MAMQNGTAMLFLKALLALENCPQFKSLPSKGIGHHGSIINLRVSLDIQIDTSKQE